MQSKTGMLAGLSRAFNSAAAVKSDKLMQQMFE